MRVREGLSASSAKIFWCTLRKIYWYIYRLPRCSFFHHPTPSYLSQLVTVYRKNWVNAGTWGSGVSSASTLPPPGPTRCPWWYPCHTEMRFNCFMFHACEWKLDCARCRCIAPDCCVATSRNFPFSTQGSRRRSISDTPEGRDLRGSNVGSRAVSKIMIIVCIQFPFWHGKFGLTQACDFIYLPIYSP